MYEFKRSKGKIDIIYGNIYRPKPLFFNKKTISNYTHDIQEPTGGDLNEKESEFIRITWRLRRMPIRRFPRRFSTLQERL